MSNKISVFVLVLVIIVLTLVVSIFFVYSITKGSSAIQSLSFESVFKDTSSNKQDKLILEQIHQEEILNLYQSSVTPGSQNQSKLVFFAYTKPLGEHCFFKSANPKGFICKINANEKISTMRSRLFLLKTIDNKVIFQLIPHTRSNVYNVPATNGLDRIIAIGSVEIPKEKYSLDKLITLDLVR